MRRIAPLIIGSVAALALAACAPTPPAESEPSTPTDTSAAGRPVPLNPLPPTMHPLPAHQIKWVDLQVGNCLSAPPPTDPSVVEVALTDCQTPHSAEVFLRANVAVNDALTGIADQHCTSGLAQYTRQPARYTSTYLIDSNMDRTGHTALPSTVICLLQSADGQPLTGSARS